MTEAMTEMNDDSHWDTARLAEESTHWHEQALEAVRAIAFLASWSEHMPRSHVPHGEPVLVTDLLPQTSDLAALPAQLDEVRAAVADLHSAVLAVHAAVRTTAFKAGDVPVVNGPAAATPEQVAVTAWLGTKEFGDDETFERQRQAVRRRLTYDGQGNWRGALPRFVGEDLGGWQAIIDAADAGAAVKVQP